MFGLHSIKHTNYKIYSAKLLLKEIALFSGAHQIKLKYLLTIIITIRICIPFIIRYIETG